MRTLAILLATLAAVTIANAQNTLQLGAGPSGGLPVSASQLVGRQASGSLQGLDPDQVRTVLGLGTAALTAATAYAPIAQAWTTSVVVPVAQGGTAATTAAGARSSLGLGTAATTAAADYATAAQAWTSGTVVSAAHVAVAAVGDATPAIAVTFAVSVTSTTGATTITPTVAVQITDWWAVATGAGASGDTITVSASNGASPISNAMTWSVTAGQVVRAGTMSPTVAAIAAGSPITITTAGGGTVSPGVLYFLGYRSP